MKLWLNVTGNTHYLIEVRKFKKCFRSSQLGAKLWCRAPTEATRQAYKEDLKTMLDDHSPLSPCSSNLALACSPTVEDRAMLGSVEDPRPEP